jgi:seryl-tRNA synthetase
MLQNLLKPPRFALSYAQCEPFYYYFKGQKIDVEKLKIFRAYDMTGFTYRYEAGGKKGLERMNEFTRIELAYVGKPKLVIESRDSVLDGYKKVADALGLEWRVAEAIPVYLEHAEEKSEERKDIVATYDFEVYLPFRGPRDKVEWLEVANASVTFDFYCRRFNIKEVKGRDLWFGCCGFGVERWVVSFLAQHGFDFEKWPSMVRKKIGALPKPPEIVTQPSK